MDGKQKIYWIWTDCECIAHCYTMNVPVTSSISIVSLIMWVKYAEMSNFAMEQLALIPTK